MPRKQRLLERVARALARWADLPLAEDAVGAMRKSEDLDPLSASQPVEPEDAAGDAAEEKFERWRTLDPFPQIAPALLNSADIDDYMHQVAMVFPYDPEKRKTASYPLSVGAEIAYWDPAKPKDHPIRYLDVGDPVVIPSNSLIYVRTREMFRLPNYIAVRFNLHIDLVHKGLLLGTGPLVDPGFSGRLMVPLHNLTSNEYVLAVGDDFIWAEFTKTSVADAWKIDESASPARLGTPKPFDAEKIDKPLSHYIRKAQYGHERLQPGLNHATLQNAIPEAIQRTRRTAEKAKASAAKSKRRANQLRITVTSIGVVALFGAGGVLFTQIQASRTALLTTLGIVNGTNVEVQKQDARIAQLEERLNQLQQKPSNTVRPTTERQ